jgi:PleD family two-component response regulator/EAL domain-containing protein (putative c-di-GMP-specific phosphodiesterase class I)
MLTPTLNSTPNSRIYYLGEDTGLQTDLDSILAHKGLTVRAFTTREALRAAAVEGVPAVLILEMDQVPKGTPLKQFLDDLFVPTGTRPELLCVAAREGIENRLEAIRAGAQGFYPVPVAALDLAQKVLQVGGFGSTGRSRVLVVEDNPAQAKYIAKLLSQAGMETRVAGEPLKVLDAIREFRPDLVLMDLYMPDANGDELTAIIRDQDDFFDLPIIFLSAERDQARQLDALRLGGDSFIAKPVQRKLLVESVEHRIRMSRWQRERRQTLSRRETTTGLLQKDHFMRHLDRCVRTDESLDEGCGLLLIEVDSPRATLDRLGFTGTEQLLHRIESELGKRMTSEESAARLSDFSYALLARRDDRFGLSELAERLLDLSGDPTATVSIGVGLFQPTADDAVTMVSRGQKAIAVAHLAGGNCVQFWAPAVTSRSQADADTQVQNLLEEAIAHNGLMLLFQPILSLAQDAGELYEVNLRLRTPDGEHIPPKVFLPVAKRSGLMPVVDHWVMKHALDVMDVKRVEHSRLRLLVHQSIASVGATHWLPWFRDQIVQRNLVRLRPLLVFQMDDVLGQMDTARLLKPTLRKYGIQVCIANCTGSAEELQALSELSVSLVKLSFHTLANTERGALTGIVRALHKQGIAFIAAGIEEPETIARVWSCRPDFLQGNYLQMPSPELSFDFTKADYL